MEPVGPKFERTFKYRYYKKKWAAIKLDALISHTICKLTLSVINHSDWVWGEAIRLIRHDSNGLF
ncbi:hypothetical protein NBRC116583_25060 [Arenicella sp. 4NH20-0111]